MTDRFKDEDYPVPEWEVVEKCLCTSGQLHERCPYTISTQIDGFFAEKEPVDNLEEGHSDMVG